MEESSRWSSYPIHERDPRMQNRVRDYDPYEMDSRQATRSGHYAEPNSSSRGSSNMKNMLANQQVTGWRKPNASGGAYQANRREGPNWILFAGGAIVTAIGVLIVRKQKPVGSDVKVLEKSSVSTQRKDRDLIGQQSGLSFARESTGSRTSELSAESPFSVDPYLACKPHSLSEGSRVGSEWGDEDCNPTSPPTIYYSRFSKGSNQSTRTIITPTSPPGSYRGAETSATECNDPLALSPPGWGSFSSRKEMVHRLRQQLKSRDEMILDMQAQISDQERTISLHQAHCRELESRAEIANKTLVESGSEIQRLRSAVADYLESHVPNSGKREKSQAASGGMSTHEVEKICSVFELAQSDDYYVTKEARRLAEELRSHEKEKCELERLATLRIKEHEVVVQRLRMLEAELVEARESDFGKGLLLEAYEVEHENLEDKVDNLKRLMEIKPPLKTTASSMIGRKSLSGSVGLFRLEHPQWGLSEEMSSSPTKDFSRQSRSLAHPFSSPLERSSSGKGKFKADESSSNGDASDDSEPDDVKPPFSEKFLSKLQEEVEQLSRILTNHSDMISEKRLETTRLLDEFQRHNAHISDIQKRMDDNVEGKPGCQEQAWENHSQYLSGNEASSAFQVQELSHKLEQIEKQQRVEEEIAELSKHQVKIAELKQRVEKLLNKTQNLEDGPGSLDRAKNVQASKMTAVAFELAKQLALQEEQARRTSREVQRLSASFQLSSPYVPRSKKEELRKMLQDTSAESQSPPLEIVSQHPANVSRLVSVLESRFATGSEGKPLINGNVLFDWTIPVSSAEPTTTQSAEESVPQTQEKHEYNTGYSEPSTRKSRRGCSNKLGSGREQSLGTKKKMEKTLKTNTSRDARKELVQSDSTRRANRLGLCAGSAGVDERRLQTVARELKGLEEQVAKHSIKGHQSAGASERPKGSRLLHSAPESGNVQLDGSLHVGLDSPVSRRQLGGRFSYSSTVRIGRPKGSQLLHSAPESGNVQLDGSLLVGLGSPVSRRQSGGSSSDSSTVRIGSPIIAAPNVKRDRSMETNSSFGRFVFDMEFENAVYGMSQDDGSGADTGSCVSPSSFTPTRSEVEEFSSSVSQDVKSFGVRSAGSPLDKGKGIVEASAKDTSDKNFRSKSESSLSIGSSFEGLLDNTLDDLLLACSTPSIPADTPETSFRKSHADVADHE